MATTARDAQADADARLDAAMPAADTPALAYRWVILFFGILAYGAMGLHFANMSLIGDGKIDATKPEILLYEPTANGRLRLTGADFLVFASDWDKTHTSAPELNGQLFHFFDAPNRFGLPPFYTLHVWAWKDNPLGTFTNWNPNVSCDGFNGQSN